MPAKFDLEVLRDFFLGKKKRKPPVHELKWKLPEERLTAPVEDAEDLVGKMKKHGRFIGGGEFLDEVHAKQYGEGVYSYFIVRTDKKTQKEKIIADAYMLREEEKLGMEVESAYEIAENLDEIGYKTIFSREVTVWSFLSGALAVNVYSVTGFGDFVEVSLPATKLDAVRKKNEEQAQKLFEKLGIKKEELVPTDAITLQYTVMMQQAEGAAGPGEGK
ncbi:MAG: hypothetical protein NTY90_04520 [Candidatus Micrarchaeota archaeon]|nr:hypothetical protein [Candidatus Micrarchaeota archaeon]